jgi:hypothetical protein
LAPVLVLGVLAVILGPAMLLSQTENLWLLAAQCFGITVLLSAFVNLVPHYGFSQNGRVLNDGMGIIHSFLRSRADYARQIQDPESPWQSEPREERDEGYDS